MKINNSSGSLRRIALMTLGVGLLLACLPAAQMSHTTAGSKVGKLPKDSTAQRQLRMLDGSQHSLMSLRGKVVVLNFFAVWCGHSRDQIPAIRQINEMHGSDGAQVVGLAVEDGQTTLSRINEFVKDQKISFPVGMVTDPIFIEYIQSRTVDVPQTLVYGRDGRLAAHFVGHSAPNDNALMDVVKKELDKK